MITIWSRLFFGQAPNPPLNIQDHAINDLMRLQMPTNQDVQLQNKFNVKLKSNCRSSEP